MLPHPAFEMFFALLALYAPAAALPSYLPVVTRLPRGDQLKLAIGLFAYVAIFALVALWIGEVLLELLGLSTAALTMTGGIALSYEGVMLMLGKHRTPDQAEDQAEEMMAEAGYAGSGQVDNGQAGSTTATAVAPATVNWQSVLLVPTTFPLTVGGATFALLVAFAAESGGIGGMGLLTIAALCYAAVTGLTCFAAAMSGRRLTRRGLDLLDRVAGILLTAIAVTLLASGGTRLVDAVLQSLR